MIHWKRCLPIQPLLTAVRTTVLNLISKYYFVLKMNQGLLEKSLLCPRQGMYVVTLGGLVPVIYTVQFSRSVMSNSATHGLHYTGFPVHHQLPELAQTHVHQVGDAIPLSHHLSSPSPAFNLSQPEGLFQ